MLELKGIHKYYNPGTVNEMCLFQNFNLTIVEYYLRKYPGGGWTDPDQWIRYHKTERI